MKRYVDNIAAAVIFSLGFFSSASYGEDIYRSVTLDLSSGVVDSTAMVDYSRTIGALFSVFEQPIAPIVIHPGDSLVLDIDFAGDQRLLLTQTPNGFFSTPDATGTEGFYLKLDSSETLCDPLTEAGPNFGFYIGIQLSPSEGFGTIGDGTDYLEGHKGGPVSCLQGGVLFYNFIDSSLGISGLTVAFQDIVFSRDGDPLTDYELLLDRIVEFSVVAGEIAVLPEEPPTEPFTMFIQNPIITGPYCPDGEEFCGGYTVTFGPTLDSATPLLRIDMGLQLTGIVPDASILDAWETGIETVWDRQYILLLGGRTYPIIVDVEFVTSNPSYIINVTDDGQGDALNWVLTPMFEYFGISYKSPGMRGQFAAHEFGHLLGLYDEYLPYGVIDPNVNKELLCDPAAAGDEEYCASIMGWLYSSQVHERHFERILSPAFGTVVLGRNPNAGIPMEYPDDGGVFVEDPWEEYIPGQSPTANAGADLLQECMNVMGAMVTLDGAMSSDPDGDPLTYTWTGPFGQVSGDVVTVTLPLGTHIITLTVDDGKGGTDTDTVVIAVGDTTPPSIEVSVSPDTLWPPNHKMVPVAATVTASDACDPSSSVALKSITTDEGDETNAYDPTFDNTIGDGNASDDIQVDSDGHIALRAERSGTGDGRVYTITYSSTDAAGNTGTGSATVTVPHNQ